jgi:formyl-CoA transferase
MVATSLMANGLWWNAIQVQGILCGARTTVRPPREEAVSALQNLYRCRDGRWFLLNLTADERRWEPFASAIGRPDLLADPRFATQAARRQHARALVTLLDDVFGARDWTAWRPILEATGIAFGVVATVDDIPHDPQMRASGALVPFADPAASDVLTVSSPITIAGHDKAPPRMPPAIGQHTTEVLREAGLKDDEITRLLEAGAVIQGPAAAAP